MNVEVGTVDLAEYSRKKPLHRGYIRLNHVGNFYVHIVTMQIIYDLLCIVGIVLNKKIYHGLSSVFRARFFVRTHFQHISNRKLICYIKKCDRAGGCESGVDQCLNIGLKRVVEEAVI